VRNRPKGSATRSKGPTALPSESHDHETSALAAAKRCGQKL
jgi:hypothetical protein